MARKPTCERTCCDGLCARQGGTCPSFAPGVLAGPYRRSASRRGRAAVRMLLACVAVVVVLAWLAVVLAMAWLGWH